MAYDEPKRWEQQLREAATRAEEELRRVVTYINDEVVPLVRQHSTTGLRVASDKLKEFADYMESTKKDKP